jgi:hypothetical protein
VIGSLGGNRILYGLSLAAPGIERFMSGLGHGLTNLLYQWHSRFPLSCWHRSFVPGAALRLRLQCR